MSNETCPPNQTERRYFGDKQFDYVQLDNAFRWFAEDCSMDAEVLLESIEEAIATRHHEAVLDADDGLRYPLWKLETDVVSFCYQVQPERILIGSIFGKVIKQFYEAKHDLMAEFD